MHSFQQILDLDSEIQIALFSNYKFPLSPEVRRVLGPWIEHNHIFEQFSNLGPQDPNIKRLIANLYIELESKGREPEPVIFGSNYVREIIANSASNILANFPENVIPLFEEIRDMLLLEEDVLHTFANGPHTMELVDEPKIYTWKVLDDFKIFNANLDQVTREHFQITFHRLYAEFDKELDVYFLKLVTQLLPRTSVRLKKWTEDKQKLVQGKLNRKSLFELKHLKVYYEYYANQLWCLWYMVNCVHGILTNLPEYLKILLNSQYFQRNLFWKRTIEEKLVSLVKESFVVSDQPSHCSRKDTKTKHRVQLLVGEQIKSIHWIQINCFIIDEIQALELQKNPGLPSLSDIGIGIKLIPNTDFLTMSDDRDYCAIFKDSKHDGHIKRLMATVDAFKTTKLYDENFWSYFYADIIMDENIQLQISTFSHPFKLTPNSSQDCEAMETVLFDIVHGRFGVESVLNRPTAAPCQDYELALNYWFKNMTGRPLDPLDLYNIKAKFFSSTYLAEILNNHMTEFTLEYLRMPIPPIPGTTPFPFNFWGWMFGITKLIKTFLGLQKREQSEKPGLWESGVLQYLFRTQQEAKLILEGKLDGGFLIRVSYTTLSAITIDFIAKGIVYSHRLTADDLKSRSLMDRLRDIPAWKVLYPQNISREDLFKRYALPSTDSMRLPLSVGYVASVQDILEKFIPTNNA